MCEGPVSAGRGVMCRAPARHITERGNKQDKNMIEEEIKERKGGNRLSFLPVPL